MIPDPHPHSAQSPLPQTPDSGLQTRNSPSIPIASPVVGDDEIEAVAAVLRSGKLSQGPRVEEFERAFASYIGSRYAIAVNSGTAALHIALLAAGIGPGDEVITTPFSFISTANAILFCGARPVFVDIDPRTYNIDPRKIATLLSEDSTNSMNPINSMNSMNSSNSINSIRALLPVHLYGQPCDMAEITEICREHNLALIEDACQAHGAECQESRAESQKSRVPNPQLQTPASRPPTPDSRLSTPDSALPTRAGSFGTGCFSFYPTKNMTTGEGGMITTNSKEIAEKARMLRSHGQSQRYLHEILGYNYRMTDIAAAIGLCQLEKLDEFNKKRADNARFLSERIEKIKGLEPPFATPNVRHVFHQFTIRVTAEFPLSRDQLRQRLSEKGIGSAIYYPLPIHRQPLYQKLGYTDHLPVAEKAAAELLSLPVHPGLKTEDLEAIAGALASA